MAISSHTKWLRFLNILFCVVILVLSGNAFTRICSPPNHIDGKFHIEILDNWKRLSIYDLTATDSTSTCDFGYEEITMSTEWPGTVKGCYCKGTNTLSTGSCSNSECTNVESTVPFPMNVWRGRKLCIRRAGTSVYWAPSPDSDGCSSKEDVHGNTIEFIKCGTGNIAVCQEKTLGCPINRIKMLKAGLPKPDDYTHSTYFGDNYVLYYGYGNSTSTEAPIIDFSISEGLPCLQDPGDEATKDKNYYTLLKKKPSGCDYEDSRFIIIDNMDEVTFYNDNDLQNITSLPKLTLSSSIKYYFSYRTSVLWKDVCHSSTYYSMNTLHDNREPFKYVNALHIAVLVIQSIFSFYLVFVDPLLLYYCYKKSEEEINEYDQPIYTILLVEKFLKIIMVPIILTTCIVVGYYRNWFANLEARCCSDPVTNACFGFVDFILDDLYSLDWANFSVIVSVLIVDMISGLCLFVSRTKENYS